MPPERRSLVCLAALCLGVGLLASCSTAHAQESLRAAPPAQPRLNIVVFVADDHGQDTGAYGNTAVKTPHLDALAAEGVRFPNAYATTASCSASRSVLLTGLHNHRTAQYGHEHDYSHFQSYANLRPLPVLLQEAGYRTARIGKFHVAPADTYRFEQVLGADGRNTVDMAERTRTFVSARDARPFFLYIATSDPHRGGGTTDGTRNGPDRFGNRPDGYPGVQTVTFDPADVVVPAWLPDTPATRAELAQYYQSIARLDQGVGRMVQVLKDAGVYEQTLFVYLSDHGAAFPGAKTTVYEPGLRSPLIVRHPRASRRGVTSDAMVSWVDITPTILEAAGAASPTYTQHIASGEVRATATLPESHGLHGRSFLPATRGEALPGWDEIYASHTFHEIQMYYPMRVVRDRRYKLIWNLAWQLPFPFSTDLWSSATWQSAWKGGVEAAYGRRTVGRYVQRDEFELYDLEQDPHESRNLARDPAHASTLATYKARLRAFQARTSDPWVLKWTYQ
jgi:N-sulfoglucosamine sulfohydrolase